MTYDSIGYLQINAESASGALPIPNVNIRIIGAEEENGSINYSVLTDRDGKTPVIPLPAPSRKYSLEPDAPEQVFANYIVEAFCDYFYPKKIFNVEIFGGIKSILPLAMIPNGGLTENVNPPTTNNVSIITENEDL